MNQTLIRNDEREVTDTDARVAINRHDLDLERASARRPAQCPPKATVVRERDITRLVGEGAMISLLVTVAIGAMLVIASVMQLPTDQLTWAAKASTVIAALLAIAIIPAAAIDALRR
jgi:hypothetical protein